MLALTIMIFPDDQAGIKASAHLELDDLLPTSIEKMPVFVKGRLIDLPDGDKLIITMAQKCRIIFNATQKLYDAIIDKETFDFKAIDTSDRGI